MDKLDASTNSNRTGDENNPPDMATVFQGFQSDLIQPIAASKSQTEAFNSLKEDPLIQRDADEEEELTARMVHPTRLKSVRRLLLRPRIRALTKSPLRTCLTT